MTKKYKIYITDYLRRNIHFDPELLGDDIEVKLLQAKSEKELFPHVEDADALIVDKVPITEYTLSRLPKCKIIARYGIGYDNVDIKAAAKHGIFVVNCPDWCHEEVADHTLGMMLAMTRNIVGYNNGLLTGDVKNWRPLAEASTIRLRDKMVGIIGLGRIGKEVAQRLQGFRVKVVFYDPNVDAAAGKKVGAEKMKSVKDLTSKSDIVTFHVPLTPETRHYADEAFFAGMKKGAYLINTSRGGVVKLKALKEAIEKGIVEKAALDVLEEEPINYKEPLIEKWLKDKHLQSHLIITPHSAFYSPGSTQDIEEKMIHNIKQVLRGKKPINCVNEAYFSK